LAESSRHDLREEREAYVLARHGTMEAIKIVDVERRYLLAFMFR